jgi:hypothetical protein
MNLSNTKDDTLILFYENVRRQVQADMQAGGRYRFMGESVKQYADRLREEMDRGCGSRQLIGIANFRL